jgi:hypothetical protein
MYLEKPERLTIWNGGSTIISNGSRWQYSSRIMSNWGGSLRESKINSITVNIT